MIALEQLSPIGIGTYQIDRVERACALRGTALCTGTWREFPLYGDVLWTGRDGDGILPDAQHRTGADIPVRVY